MVGQEVAIDNAQRYAKNAFHSLMPFMIMMSTTAEKQDAIARVTELRIELQEQFDIICPGWEEIGE